MTTRSVNPEDTLYSGWGGCRVSYRLEDSTRLTAATAQDKGCEQCITPAGAAEGQVNGSKVPSSHLNVIVAWHKRW